MFRPPRPSTCIPILHTALSDDPPRLIAIISKTFKLVNANIVTEVKDGAETLNNPGKRAIVPKSVLSAIIGSQERLYEG